MVCNEKASQQQIEAMDKKIAGFGRRPSAFKSNQPVPSDNEQQVAKITREVEAIHRHADDLLHDIKGMLQDAEAHKRVHLVEWAKRGCPEDEADEDFVGIELGNALESALERRKEAVEAVRAQLMGKVPLVVEAETHHDESPLSDEQLIAIAKAALVKK